MFQFAVLTLLASFGAALATLVASKRPKFFLLRVLLGAVAASVGVGLSFFAADGFGWGWSDPSSQRITFLLTTAGIGVGLSHALFAWITSGRLAIVPIIVLITINPALLMISADHSYFRFASFAVSNFIVLCLWLAQTGKGNR